MIDPMAGAKNADMLIHVPLAEILGDKIAATNRRTRDV